MTFKIVQARSRSAIEFTMKFTIALIALLIAPAAAFMPTSARTRGLTTIKMGYVPDGLTPAEVAVKSSQNSHYHFVVPPPNLT